MIFSFILVNRIPHMFLLFTDYFPVIMSLKTQHKHLVFSVFMFVWITEFYILDLNDFKDMCIINVFLIIFFYFNFISINHCSNCCLIASYLHFLALPEIKIDWILINFEMQSIKLLNIYGLPCQKMGFITLEMHMNDSKMAIWIPILQWVWNQFNHRCN